MCEKWSFSNLSKIGKSKIPIYKSGKYCSANNYRSFSLLSPINKVLESLICKRLIKSIEENSIIADQQFGFRRQHYAVHAVTDVYSQISINLDNKLQNFVASLDLRNAFDKIYHDILLKKVGKIWNQR